MTFDSESAPSSFRQLNKVYAQWIGSFMDDLYVLDEKRFKNVRRFGHDIFNCCSSLQRRLCSCCPCVKPYYKLTDESNDVEKHTNQTQAADETKEWTQLYKHDYTEDQMIRDLFLWALFTTEIDMVKIFLKHLKPRICAALIATRVYKHFSKEAPNAFAQQKLEEEAEEFEEFATKCVETCYAHDEKMTCELLIREVPLFGNVTCMQVAVAGECAKFFATPCVDELLNQIWYDKLTMTNVRSLAQPLILVNLLTFGLFAFCWMPYRNIDIQKHDQTAVQELQITDKEAVPDKENYMMLYKFDAPSKTQGRLHGTEIYVIITISALLCEELRQLRDLSAFVYIIFIFIAAYGVVSRSMISYGNVEFSGHGIFSNILYPPYWFIYGNNGDELATLDKMIANDKEKSNAHWNEFENAATYYYAQNAVEKKKKQAEESVFSDPVQKKEESTANVEVVAVAKNDILNVQHELQNLHSIIVNKGSLTTSTDRVTQWNVTSPVL
ncbi:unnamed protein product [Didymodactylos carnosus]|uniref:TRPM-like domain-containing protein n=1 Tax=Didymodactylos carnosus TaxID=1234261 RepID=A0A813TAS6_9BILA|nr:unnamed protein product [Didymodactylos carnosus]CAF0811272.1 unnamed protein product [Didymodactylos carnosus]CAF3585053.1 unnamed protein product [Didymodactylos carnosus]CAF3596930.1 unnamed protein product [Didymodactylos carnosus]